MKLLVLSATEILSTIQRAELRLCMVRCLKDYTEKKAINFLRHVVEIDPDRILGFMPAFAVESGLIGYKAVSVFSKNCERQLNAHQGIVVLSNPNTGEVKALLEGSTVTALRTAAVSAAATDALSRKDSQVLTIIGTGRQAFEHALAIAEVRPLKKIIVCGRSNDHAEDLRKRLNQHLNCQIIIESTIAEAIQNADIIATCTSSCKALFDIRDVPKGAHINAIGACRPGHHEVVMRSQPGTSIYLDSRQSCFIEASEIVDSLASGKLFEDSIHGEIGELFLGKISGRKSSSDITVFKSVGLGIEDVAAAELIVAKAENLKLGTVLDLNGEHEWKN